MSNSRLKRRSILKGGLLILAGCGAPPALDEPDTTLAQGPEDEMSRPQQPAETTQPLVLWGSVLAQPNVDSAVPNEQLANPFGLPMELLAIRFRLVPQPQLTEDVNARATGGTVKVKFDLGPAPIASDIPISLFGDMRDTYENSTGTWTDSGSDRVAPTYYDWRLKYPLFIPANKVVAAVFTPIGMNPIPVKVDVLYICRTWDPSRPEPKKTKVPWAASFESKTFNYETGQAKIQSLSSNLDVVNPFGIPLELARISGRCTALRLTAPSNRTEFIYEDLAEFRKVLAKLRMRSSRGFDLIRTPVAFDGVFPANWRSWDILDGWSMAPQEYYAVQVDVPAISGTIAASNVATAQFSVGIVGYRDVDVATIKGAP